MSAARRRTRRRHARARLGRRRALARMPASPRLFADVAFALRRVLTDARRIRVLIVTQSATYARKWLAECDRQMDVMRLGWRVRSLLPRLMRELAAVTAARDAYKAQRDELQNADDARIALRVCATVKGPG